MWFVIAIILFVIGIPLFIIGRVGRNASDEKRGSYDTFTPRRVALWIQNAGLMVVGVGVLSTGLSTFWTQDIGEASVLRTWTGNIVGTEIGEGAHLKAPWVDAVTFDIRNKRVVFVNPETSSGDNSGGESDGREIAVTDSDGVKSDADITVRYSIDPTQILTIYREFKNEDGLKATLIFNDIRSVTRSAAGQATTLQLLGPGRDDVAADIQKRLTGKWDEYGIEIDEVSLQQVLAPKSVQDAYSNAQKSQIDVQKAENDLEAVKISSQEKVVQAQAEADANELLNESLTPAILQQRYLDTLAKLAKKGNLVVVPEGFNGLVNVSK